MKCAIERVRLGSLFVEPPRRRPGAFLKEPNGVRRKIANEWQLSALDNFVGYIRIHRYSVHILQDGKTGIETGPCF